MLQTILKVFFKGILISITITIFLVVFGPFIGFVVYHLNFSVFWLTQSFLEPLTVSYIMLSFYIQVSIKIFKKIQSIFS